MDFMGNKALLIAVALFITLGVATGIILITGQIGVIYQQVYETDVSISDTFDGYAMYNETELYGIEVYNAVRKFKEEGRVTIQINGLVLNTEALKNDWIEGKFGGFDIDDMGDKSRKYQSSYVIDDYENVTLTFVYK